MGFSSLLSTLAEMYSAQLDGDLVSIQVSGAAALCQSTARQAEQQGSAKKLTPLSHSRSGKTACSHDTQVGLWLLVLVLF